MWIRAISVLFSPLDYMQCNSINLADGSASCHVLLLVYFCAQYDVHQDNHMRKETSREVDYDRRPNV